MDKVKVRDGYHINTTRSQTDIRRFQEAHAHSLSHTNTYTQIVPSRRPRRFYGKLRILKKKASSEARHTSTNISISTKHSSTQRQLAGRTTPSTPSTPSTPLLALALTPSLFLESIGDIGILGIGKINKRVVTHLTQPYSGTANEPRVDTLIMLYISLEVDVP